MTTSSGKRLQALDVMRGITIAAMILFNNPGSWKTRYAPLRHADWIGLTPTDLAYPFFMFIMGVAIAFSMRRYLQPTAAHWPLDRYVTPDEFARFKDIALQKGFRFVASSPLVRSSYRAAEALEAVQGGKADGE